MSNKAPEKPRGRSQKHELRTSGERLTATSVRRTPRSRGVRWKSKAMLFGWPLCEVALGPDSKRGEHRGHARAVLALGNIADGIFAVGGVSRGVVAIGGISCGLLSLGGVSLGLVAALGGVAVAPLALGGVAAGVLATGGAGWNIHGRIRKKPTLGNTILPHLVGWPGRLVKAAGSHSDKKSRHANPT